MSNDHHDDRLSWGDTVFLNLERQGMPLNVASVSILEGDIPFEQYLRFVESRLPRIPRYLKRVVATPLSLGLPSWEFDPDFDIRNHVREASLKRGSEAELKALTGKILSNMLDRQHPLWELTLVRGLKGDRTGLIARMHHCLADGIAGVGIMSALMDISPALPRLPKRKFRLHVPSSRDAATSLVEGLASSYSDLVQRVLSSWANVLSVTEQTLANGGSQATDEISRLLPEVTTPAERLRFNVLYQGPQKFAYTEIPLGEVKAIRHACGTSINDVLLALVTATMQRYSEFHGDTVKGRLLRLMVPVNLRGNDSGAGLGNHISLVPVTIPLDIHNPTKLLTAVHKRTEFLKRSRAAELVSLAGGLLSILPGPMQAFAGPLISQVPFTPFNMVCTNVPGPQFPLYVLGHKMLHWYPYVPIGGEMAVNCAILSYNGMVYFGFSGDVHVAPDLSRLEKFLTLSFTELCNTAGIKRQRKRSPRKHATAQSQVVNKMAVPDASVNTLIPLTTMQPSEVQAVGTPDPTTDGKKFFTRSVA